MKIWSGKYRNTFANIFLGLFFLLSFLVLVETTCQIYVYRIAKQGKLYTPDSVLGWKALPNLGLERKNPNGEFWVIKINKDGFRSPSSWDANAEKRVLILGDSFAFGEGVNLEDRFDSIIMGLRPTWSFINLGMSGYGTDQEIIAGRKYFDLLKTGDVVVLLTHMNDFHDILRHASFGRAKPRFELNGKDFIERPPPLGFTEILRDKSYLFSFITSRFERRRPISADEIFQSAGLYYALVQSMRKELRRDVRLIAAFHGMNFLTELNAASISKMYERLCVNQNIDCISLDEDLTGSNGNFFPDSHWTKEGHGIVAHKILEHIETKA